MAASVAGRDSPFPRGVVSRPCGNARRLHYNRPMRTVLGLLVGLTLACSACSPPCEDTTTTPDGVCRRADAGAIAPQQPFTFTAISYLNGPCTVGVDGGSITVSIAGTSCAGPVGSGGAAAPRAPGPIPCEMPALPAGTFVFSGGLRTTFTLPAAADAGFPDCL